MSSNLSKKLVTAFMQKEIKEHTICLIAISKDFLDSVRPKPELSGEEADFPDMLL